MEFDEYVAARGRQLVRLGYVLSGDHYQAEDLAQNALMNAYRHWRRVRRMDDPHAYVRRILVNAHLSAARRGLGREVLAGDVEPDRQVPDLATLLVEHDAMWRALAQLPPRERAVVVLRYYEDLDHTAIAAALEIGVSTARSTLSRALATLRSAHDSALTTGATREHD